MHELPVTQSILQIVTAHAQQAHAVRITDIYLVIGDLTSFVDESIQYYWDIISQGTTAQGAALHFKRTAAYLKCAVCGQESRLDSPDMVCGHCGSDRVAVEGGQEFYVESINVETEDERAG